MKILREVGSCWVPMAPSPGCSDAVQAQLYDVTLVRACAQSFAALRRDGRIVTWGAHGSKCRKLMETLKNVEE